MAWTWAPILLGWPAIIGTLLLTAVGILARRFSLPLVSSFLVLGFAFYVAGWPSLRWFAPFLPALHIAAAATIYFRRPWLAWLCIIPQAAVALYLGAMVLSQ